jgi:hypothetical protein
MLHYVMFLSHHLYVDPLSGFKVIVCWLRCYSGSRSAVDDA